MSDRAMGGTPIRIFVGTDERSVDAEVVLEHSIRKRTKRVVEFTWMRAGDPGWQWAYQPRAPDEGWHTRFTCFRYAIPELCDFRGRAIYMDSDMVILGDVEELWGMWKPGKWRCISQKRTDVSVIDCAALAARRAWPTVATMRESPRKGFGYRQTLMKIGVLDPTLEPAWNSIDRLEDGTKLVHFSDVTTQPWRPWPEKIAYKEHPDPGAVALWQNERDEARNG